MTDEKLKSLPCPFCDKERTKEAFKILRELRKALGPSYSESPEGRAYLERMDEALK